MSPGSETSAAGTVCSLNDIKAVNDCFHQQQKQNFDWNFIDFVIDYLLSSDKSGKKAADVDKLIQDYVKLNPQLREQLVVMLKNLAEVKEIKIDPSHEAAVLPKKTTKVNSDKESATRPTKLSSSPNLASSTRSPTRRSPTLSAATSSSDVRGIPTPDVSETPSLSEIEASSPESKMLSAPPIPKVVLTTPARVRDDGAKIEETLPEPSAPPPSPTSPQLQVGYVRVVGATTKALRLLRLEDASVDNITLMTTTPKRIDDSDCDEVFQFAGCTYEELNKKKKNAAAAIADDDDENENEDDDDETIIDAAAPAAEVGSATGSAACVPKDALEFAVLERMKEITGFNIEDILGSRFGLDTASSSGRSSSTYLAISKPLRLVEDIESRTPKVPARSQQLVEGEIQPHCLAQAECCAVTSLDDLTDLVAEIFPNDMELQEAFANKAHNSLDLWKFIVKYGRMYKDFVNEVLEMVNELKKGLVGAMDAHREKTNEILDTHKREMCLVVERARASDHRVEALEKELVDLRQLADDHRVKTFTQEEEILKLQKDLTAKEKRIRNFDNVKKELLSDRDKIKQKKEELATELESSRSDLMKAKSDTDSLRERLKRSWQKFDETDYKLRELEGKLSEERAETERYKKSNSLLAKKMQTLQNEVTQLKANQKLVKELLILLVRLVPPLPECHLSSHQ
ncbi:dynactin subunit 1 [Galendromus occidentalis]|uniref:Dynactin subunit 1 n=1 Tax=Galendromus occidentalis TaxID=34638 RepID=A0AAJ7SFP8_9ACAR|nr:dynactin subunit 1 [Galendromus occidentalis]